MHSKIDLRGRAHLEMVEAGFVPDFEPEVLRQIKGLDHDSETVTSDLPVIDLRALLWSSIDNPDSRDLDQIEYAERLPDGNIHVMIGIADVDSLVPKGSAIDHHALENTTSVYTGIVTYPMLPEQLSTDLTSLNQDEDRRAIVIDLTVDQAGTILASDVRAALVRNQAKLDYIMVGNWLESGGPPPDRIANVSGLADQLRLQYEITEQLRELRRQHGALLLQTIEANPVMQDGQVLDLEQVDRNPARDLIENFMIAGNIAVSHFLEGKNFPSLRRVVKTPERWEKIVEVAQSYGDQLPPEADAKALAEFLLERRKVDPVHFPDLSLTIVKLLGSGEYIVEVPGQMHQGHFALAVRDYTHATAPNRRFPDLVTQRMIKAAIAAKPAPYSLSDLDDVALQCTRKEDAANKVERTMRKVAAAVLLSKHIGDIYDGIVTGVKADAVFVRLLKPPVEGRIIQGEHGLDVGDKVKVRLIATDPDRAFIDFARVKKHQG